MQKTRESKINLKIGEKLISNPLDIADHFNEVYYKMSGNLVDKLPTPTNRYSDKETAKYYKPNKLEENNYFFKLTDEESVAKILRNEYK